MAQLLLLRYQGEASSAKTRKQLHSRGAASPGPTAREVSEPTVRAAAAQVLGAARRWLDELWAASRSPAQAGPWEALTTVHREREAGLPL